MYFEMDCPCKGKNLDKLLQSSILKLLYSQRLYRAEIICGLAESPLFRGASPDKAGVYRYLKRMEESGILLSSWDIDENNSRPRKVYAISHKGKECLDNWVEALNGYAASIKQMLAEIEKEIKE